MRGHKLALALAAVVVIAVAVAAFATDTGRSYDRLMWVGSSSGSGNDQSGPPGTSWVFGSYDPCVDSGSVTVTGFAFTRASGLVMSDWGFQVNHGSGTGSHPGTVKSSGLTHGPATITNTCADTQANRAGPSGNLGDLFAFVVSRTGTATGWSNGLTVTYRSSGASHVSHWPVSFALCGKGPAQGKWLAGICSGT